MVVGAGGEFGGEHPLFAAGFDVEEGEQQHEDENSGQFVGVKQAPARPAKNDAAIDRVAYQAVYPVGDECGVFFGMRLRLQVAA